MWHTKRIQTTFHEIPVVDLNDSPERVSALVGDACRRVGFLTVVNHGVSNELVDQTLAESRGFFSLSAEKKSRVAMNTTHPLRGYFAVGQETLNFEERLANYKGDLKEGLDLGVSNDPAHVEFFGPNQWPKPEDCPRFRITLESYMNAMAGLGSRIMSIFALELGLREDFFEDKIDNPMSTLRLNHYKPQDGGFDQHMGCGAHSDYGLCTILKQDMNGGLFARNVGGEWIHVDPIEDSFVVNLGDMLAKWSGTEWKSTVHKVVNTSREERYSLPYFMNPNPDVLVKPLNGQGAGRLCREILSDRYVKSGLK